MSLSHHILAPDAAEPTHIFFDLWLGNADKPPPSGARSCDRIAGTEAQSWQALIVEDELFIALHLESILQELGVEVREIVASGREAVEAALRSVPDIVFMDINLRGDMDGIEAARRVREQLDCSVVFVTAYRNPATVSRIEEEVPGAPILQKPLMPQALEAVIRTITGP